jgi:tRNA pseudouridine55 synthase
MTPNQAQALVSADSQVAEPPQNSQFEQRQKLGLLLLDKTPDMSSNLALQKAKRLLGIRKAGHTGSLDPLASGLLPICIGRATRLSAYLLNEDKRYVVEIKLGVTTETGDAEGDILVEKPVPALTSDSLDQIISTFIGEIEQVPPMYSALKHNGKRLYELARQGIEVERKARPITIHQIAVLAYSGDLLELDVSCSKGTYIRTLAEDIGNKIGCGAHVSSLRRTEVGDLNVKQAWTLQQLEAIESKQQRWQCVLDADHMLSEWPSVSLTEELEFYLSRGQAVWMPKLPTSGWLRIYDKDNLFIGIGEITDDGKLAPRRMFTG